LSRVRDAEESSEAFFFNCLAPAFALGFPLLDSISRCVIAPAFGELDFSALAFGVLDFSALVFGARNGVMLLRVSPIWDFGTAM
jgi:hypothetical protein